MSEKSAGGEATVEKITDNESTGEESTNRPIDLLSIDSLLVNSLFRYWLPPVLWMGAIFIFSSQPKSTLPSHPDALVEFILKKTAHIIEYGILAFLLWRAISRGWDAPSRSAFIAFVISALYAASDEYHQTFVPGRHGRLRDVGIDAVGALVALLVVGGLGKKRR